MSKKESLLNEKYQVGAKKLLDSLGINKKDPLTVLNTAETIEFTNQILIAAKEQGYTNVINVVIPAPYRPVTEISPLLKNVIQNSKAVVYSVDRRNEENFTFNRPLQQLCQDSKCKYVYIYDPSLDYLKDGMAADYEAVAQKAQKIKGILEKSSLIEVKSKLGTDLEFKLYTDTIIPRSPIFNPGFYWNQAPEGEVMSCPLETTFNGRMVIDGVITGMGTPPTLIIYDFKDGVITDVEGDKQFLDKLLSMLRKSDDRVESFIGMWIAELSVGCNDWAVFDDNISNCEKVSGGIHFAMGNSEGLGADRGETYHFDHIMKAPSIWVTDNSGNRFQLIDDGKLLV